MLNKKNRWILFASIFALIAIISYFFDDSIIKFIILIRNYYLDKLFLGVTFIYNEIIIAILLTILLFWRKRDEWILPLWITMLATALISLILKITVHRQRPFATGVIPLLSGIADNIKYHVWDFSFPSFDSAFIFCTVPIMSKFFPKFKYVWISLAVLVAFSRVYVGVHYLSDVISGALIGYIIGVLIIEFENRKKLFGNFYNKIRKR